MTLWWAVVYAVFQALRRNHMGEMLCIGVRWQITWWPFLFPVHWMNSWFLLVHCFSSKIGFYLGERLLESRWEMKKFLPVDRNLLVSTVYAVILKHWRVFYSDLTGSPISIISPISFHINLCENGKCSSSSQEHLKKYKTKTLNYSVLSTNSYSVSRPSPIKAPAFLM